LEDVFYALWENAIDSNELKEDNKNDREGVDGNILNCKIEGKISTIIVKTASKKSASIFRASKASPFSLACCPGTS